jgi:hypothetical protein
VYLSFLIIMCMCVCGVFIIFFVFLVLLDIPSTSTTWYFLGSCINFCTCILLVGKLPALQLGFTGVQLLGPSNILTTSFSPNKQ